MALHQTSEDKIKIRNFTISFRTMPEDMKQAAPGGLDFVPQKKAASSSVLGKTEAGQEISSAKIKPAAPKIDITPAAKQKKQTRLAEKNQTPLLYKAAKTLYKKNLFQEAIIGFQDVLKIDPKHWRANWFLKRSQNKLLKQRIRSQKERQVQPQAPRQEPVYPVQKIEITEEAASAPEQPIPATTPQPAENFEAEIKKVKQELAQKTAQEEQKIKELEQQIASDQAMLAEEQKARQELAQKFETAQQEKQTAQARLEEEHQALLEEKTKLEEQVKKNQEQLQAASAQPKASLLPPMTTPAEAPAPVEKISLPEEKPLLTSAPQIAVAPVENQLTQIPTALPETTPRKSIFFLLSSLRLIRIAVALIIFTAVITGSIYGIGLWQKQEEETLPPPVSTQEILPPTLIPTDKTETITLQTGQKKNFANSLKTILDKNEIPGTITRVLIKLIDDSQNQKYLSLGETADLLQIVFQAEVLQSLGNNYTFFVYSQKELPLSPFAAGLGRNKTGLVANVGQKEKIAQQMISWEQDMEKDLDALFMGKKISFSQETQWSDISYLDYQIRSLFLPDEHSSLNYAFVNDNLIIATSLETIKTIIDRSAPNQ